MPACRKKLGFRRGARSSIFTSRGAHPLAAADAASLRLPSSTILRCFRSAPGDFDYRNGSIGNFILTGAYLRQWRQHQRADCGLQGLCAIEGQCVAGLRAGRHRAVRDGLRRTAADFGSILSPGDE
jgi:hypothetical protein